MPAPEITVDSLGRIVIPIEQRRELGLKPGATLQSVIENGELRILTTRASIRRIQAAFKPYRPKEGEPLLSDELIRERRAEAASE